MTRYDWVRCALVIIVLVAVILIAHSPIGSWRIQ